MLIQYSIEKKYKISTLIGAQEPLVEKEKTVLDRST